MITSTLRKWPFLSMKLNFSFCASKTMAVGILGSAQHGELFRGQWDLQAEQQRLKMSG
jgi:hypothetical protein